MPDFQFSSGPVPPAPVPPSAPATQPTGGYVFTQEMPTAAPAGFLCTKAVTKSFGKVPALRGVDLTIKRGESVVIMGPSGSGKSTLLHCLSGILTPDSGVVELAGQPISKLSDRDRSHLRLQRFGFVFQDGQLVPELPSAENIALPLRLVGVPRGEAMRRANELLAQLGLSQLANRRPGDMSGGQQQRIAIARALAARPEVIFADEPTGSLDQSTGQEVMQLLTTIVKVTQATLVLVTHDMNVAKWGNRLVEIRDGVVYNQQFINAQQAGAQR